MSKAVFSDGTEVEVNDVSSVYAITLDTVDIDEIATFKDKLTIPNLKHIKIVNENPDMCSEGNDFKFVEIESRNMMPDETEPTATTFMLRPMTEVEKKIVNLGNKAVELASDNDATANAVEELAALITEIM